MQLPHPQRRRRRSGGWSPSCSKDTAQSRQLQQRLLSAKRVLDTGLRTFDPQRAPEGYTTIVHICR